MKFQGDHEVSAPLVLSFRKKRGLEKLVVAIFAVGIIKNGFRFGCERLAAVAARNFFRNHRLLPLLPYLLNSGYRFAWIGGNTRILGLGVFEFPRTS